jgi:hypothetical protein
MSTTTATEPGPPASELELLRRYLAGRDVLCPQCKYNLRDLSGTICPECGEELVLRVQPVEPRQAAPLAGVITLSLGAGFNLLLLLFIAIEYVHGGADGTPPAPIMLHTVIGSAVMSGLVGLWLWQWRRIRRLDPYRRWLLVAACGLAVLIDLVMFIKIVG